MSADPSQEEDKKVQDAIKGAVSDGSEAEDLTDQIRAMIDAAAGSIDEYAWTPGRVITVFFPEFYDREFVNHHRNIIFIVLGFVLSIIAARDKLIELKAIERESRSERFIISSLIRKKEVKNYKENQGLSQEQSEHVLKELKKIANELFPGRELKKTEDGSLELDEVKKQTVYSKKLLIPEWMQSFLDKIEKSDNLFYKFLKLMIFSIKNIWNFLSAHSFYYWIIWFFVVFLISATFSIPLGLGLAAIVPGLYLILKLGFYIKNKNAAAEKNIPIGVDELIVIHIYLAKLKLDSLKAELKEENIDSRPEAVLATDEQEKIPIKEETFKSIFKRKKLLIFSAFMSALFSGYVVAIFIQWPLTDFLISVLHVPGLAGSGAFAFSATAIPILFGLALGIGLVLAIVEGIKKHDQIEKSKAIAGEFIQKNQAFLSSKHTFERNIQTINDLIAGLDSTSAEKWKKRIEQIPRDLWPEQSSGLEKFRRRFAMFITGGGSGIFIVRTLLFASTLGIIPLFFTLSWGLTLGIALGVGVLWGLFKIGTMIQAKEEARELQIIDRFDYFKWSYENYSELLDRMEKGIRAERGAQTKTKKLAKRAGCGRISTGLSLETEGSLTAPLLPPKAVTPSLQPCRGRKKEEE